MPTSLHRVVVQYLKIIVFDYKYFNKIKKRHINRYPVLSEKREYTMPISSEKKYTKLAKKILQDYKQTFATNLYNCGSPTTLKVHHYFRKWSSSILLNADNGFDKFSV